MPRSEPEAQVQACVMQYKHKSIQLVLPDGKLIGHDLKLMKLIYNSLCCSGYLNYSFCTVRNIFCLVQFLSYHFIYLISFILTPVSWHSLKGRATSIFIYSSLYNLSICTHPISLTVSSSHPLLNGLTLPELHIKSKSSLMLTHLHTFPLFTLTIQTLSSHFTSSGSIYI